MNGEAAQSDEAYQPYANWTIAERPLDGAEADTLVILDCCNAANVMKGSSEQTRSYELMTAAGKNMPTPSPGPRSYTTALINSLKVLKQRESQPFTTSDLNQMIMKQRSYDSPSYLFNRRPNMRTRHISIAPPETPNSNNTRPLIRRAGYLDLRIAFESKSSLSLAEVKTIASELSKLPKSTSLNICDIEWIGFTPRKDSPQFKRIMRIARITHLFLGAMTRFKMKKLCKRKRDINQLANAPRSPKRRRTAAYPVASPVDEQAKSLLPQSPLTPSASSRGATPGS